MTTVTAEMIKTMAPADIAAMLNTLSAAVAAKNKLSFKVGEKGGVSVFGLNSRFPVTLYAQQWERLIEAIPQLQAFLKANAASLSRK
jgi:hypothetical protein